MALRTDRSIEPGFSQVTQTQNSVIPDEGTFTPDLYGSTGALDWDSLTSLGRYQKVGNKVSVDIYINGTNLLDQGAGFLRIGSFPFSANASTFSNIGYVQSDKAINQVRFTNNGTEAILLNNGAAAPVSAISLGANLSLMLRIDYWLVDPA